MIKQLIIGLACEGPTDARFLSSIIKRTFEDVIFEFTTNVEILDVQNIIVPNDAFNDYARNAAKEGAEKFGILVLCLHADADDFTDENTFETKIKPAIESIANSEIDICKNIIPIVPIKMTESWLLADQECFKDEIGTSNSFADLGIDRPPENLSDPKNTISEAIRIAFEDKPARRKRPKISELYLPIGQKCSIVHLEKLTSYSKFKDAVKDCLLELNYIQSVD
ncbi:DUF4276 family protein [Pricia sp.]|uniref:DUF4276 family protein n=1 Tax=Pricia sp. TaxID=2268138 RepID=UPI003593019D